MYQVLTYCASTFDLFLTSFEVNLPYFVSTTYLILLIKSCTLLSFFVLSSQLNKLGFTNIDALEPADQLLKNSPDKHLYKKCIYACLGQGSVTDLADGMYWTEPMQKAQAFALGALKCVYDENVLAYYNMLLLNNIID